MAVMRFNRKSHSKLQLLASSGAATIGKSLASALVVQCGQTSGTTCDSSKDPNQNDRRSTIQQVLAILSTLRILDIPLILISKSEFPSTLQGLIFLSLGSHADPRPPSWPLQQQTRE